MADQNSIDLVARAQQRDRQAQLQIYLRYYKEVYYLARVELNDGAEAEDVTLETFIVVLTYLGQLHNPLALRAWLLQIAANQCKTHLRRRVDIPMEDEQLFTGAEEYDTIFLPQVALDDAEASAMILQVVHTLPLEQRQTVLYYYYSQFPVVQIAEMMDCSEGTVKSRLYTARQTIRNALERLNREEGLKLYGGVPLALPQLLQRAAEGISLPAHALHDGWLHLQNALPAAAGPGATGRPGGLSQPTYPAAASGSGAPQAGRPPDTAPVRRTAAGWHSGKLLAVVSVALVGCIAMGMAMQGRQSTQGNAPLSPSAAVAGALAQNPAREPLTGWFRHDIAALSESWSEPGFYIRRDKIASPKYDRVSPFTSDGTAMVWNRYVESTLIDTNFEPVVTFPPEAMVFDFGEYDNAVIAYVDESRYSDMRAGLVDKAGNMLMEPQFDVLYRFLGHPVSIAYNISPSAGTPIRPGEMNVYLVDTAGNIVKELPFGRYYGFDREGLARFTPEMEATEDTLYGYIDLQGNVVAEPGPILPVSGTPMREINAANDTYYFINSEGQNINGQEYIQARRFSEGLAAVEQNGFWHYIDTTGASVLSGNYTYATSFSNGYAKVGMEENYTSAIIDLQGNILFTYKSNTHSDIVGFNREGYAIIDTEEMENGGYVHIVDTKGNRYYTFDSYTKSVGSSWRFDDESGCFLVKDGHFYGIIDQMGNHLSPEWEYVAGVCTTHTYNPPYDFLF